MATVLYKVVLKPSSQVLPITVLIGAPTPLIARQRVLTRYPDSCTIIKIDEVDLDQETVFQVRATFQRVRVEIIKCSAPRFWYRKSIGRQYDGLLITDDLEGEGYVTSLVDVLSNDKQKGVIATSDCTVIRIENYHD